MAEKSKLFLLLPFLFFIQFTCNAQKYITAAGLRMSRNEAGASLQQKVLPHATVECIGAFNLREYYFSALLEKHDNILWGDGFNSYYGAGPRFGHIGDSSYAGADVIIGIEYKILLLPIVFSADVKPGFRLHQDNWFELGVGVSFRYILIKEKRKKLFDGNK